MIILLDVQKRETEFVTMYVLLVNKQYAQYVSQLHTIKLCMMLMYNIKPKNSINTFCSSHFVTKIGKHWKMKRGK
jgi:hypothetical protein